MDGFVLEVKSFLFFEEMILGLFSSSKLNWNSYNISIAKFAFKKMGSMIHSMKFLPPEAALYLYKSTL